MEKLLSEEQLQRLSDTITEVEKATTGELRLIIVGRSSRSSHVFPLLAFLFSTFALIYLWYSRHMFVLEPKSWLVPALLFTSAVLAYALSRVPIVQRRLTWPADLEHQVLARAELEFHREGLDATENQTGILLFLSVLEHQAVVLADKGIAQKLDENVWTEVVAQILEGARHQHLAQNLEAAIRRCGELLQKHFPAQPGNRNELPNHVIVKP